MLAPLSGGEDWVRKDPRCCYIARDRAKILQVSLDLVAQGAYEHPTSHLTAGLGMQMMGDEASADDQPDAGITVVVRTPHPQEEQKPLHRLASWAHAKAAFSADRGCPPWGGLPKRRWRRRS
ncbi:hypothetical protein GCM10010431_87240 [Streptomyces kunmingensis]